MHVFLRAASGGVSDPPVLREKIPGKVVSPPFFLAVAVLASVIRPSDGNALMDVVVGIGIFGKWLFGLALLGFFLLFVLCI
jgi:hypothetical protein